jgi:Holliday junction resolvase RusA-like endonuclease
MTHEIKISPIGKPRMVRSDSWRKRPCVQRYWAFKDELTKLCSESGYVQGEKLYAIFGLPVPKSWKKQKKLDFVGHPHDQKFDIDNIVKAVLDCLMPEGDEKVHTVCVQKLWTAEPVILFYDTLEEWIVATEHNRTFTNFFSPPEGLAIYRK